MSKVLQILTKPDSKREIQSKPVVDGDKVSVEVVDLTIAQPDYGQLVDKIFEADRVQVW